MTTTFSAKQLRATLTLIPINGMPQNFPGTGANQLILTNLRMSATIEGAANYANSLELRIFGMEDQHMHPLTPIFFGPTPTAIGSSTVLLESNDGTGWNQVFTGSITNAVALKNDAPDVALLIQAIIGYTKAVAGGPPLSYPQGADAATIAQTIATAMGMSFKNSGVTAQLAAGAYFPGTPRDQLNALSRGLAFDYYIDNNTVTICQQYKAEVGASTVQLSPGNGLMGYPMPEVGGIQFDCYFTPQIQLAGLVKISGSEVPYANGLWSCRTRTHQLDAQVPDGKWQTTIHALYEAAQ